MLLKTKTEILKVFDTNGVEPEDQILILSECVAEATANLAIREMSKSLDKAITDAISKSFETISKKAE